MGITKFYVITIIELLEIKMYINEIEFNQQFHAKKKYEECKHIHKPNRKNMSYIVYIDKIS